MNESRPELTHIAIKCSNLERSIAFYTHWCQLKVLHQREDPSPDAKGTVRVAWMGREKSARFWIVLLEAPRQQGSTSLFDHLGFALESREAVDALAKRAQEQAEHGGEKILHWPPEDHGDSAGYLCGLRDPDGNVVEFSFGQQQ